MRTNTNTATITNHEFTLVLDYVLWVIDNRSWLEDKQAYVKWITYVLDFFSEEEEKKYEMQFKKFARKLGVSGAQVDMLLMKRDAEDFFDEEDFFEEGSLFEGLEPGEIFERDRTADNLETGFFLMTDDEKFDFLIDKGPDYIDLVQDYVSELANKEEFEKLQDFYKKFNEKHKDFFPLHFIMGTAYLDKDPAFAKSCFEETLRIAPRLKEVPEEIKDALKLNMIFLEAFLQEESSGEPEKKTGAGKKKQK